MLKIMDVAASAMNAQMLRLNTTASNMANAGDISGSEDTVYRAQNPVFESVLMDAQRGSVGVEVTGIQSNNAPVNKRYEPGHPQADENGYIYMSNVNVAEEMANMISASRSYQSSAEVFNTSKTLMLRTLQLGQ